MMRCRSWYVCIFAIWLACELGTFRAQALDKLYLRDGTSLAGQIVSQNNDTYVFSGSGFGTTPIAKSKVRFALYGDSKKASKTLGLNEVRKHISSPSQTTILVLPTEAFGREVNHAVRNAKQSIQLMTYRLGSGHSSSSREFFSLLKEKAKAKKKVTVIVPFGSQTHPEVKKASISYGQELAKVGIQVRYVQKRKVQHKKLILVDGKTVFVGSSNLTSAGMSKNAEMNVKITHPGFVKEAKKDFTSMLRMAKTHSALDM